MKKNCKICNKEIIKPINESIHNWENRHLYCSKKCKIESMKGKTYSPEVNLKKGRKGHLVSIETRKKIANSKRGSKSHFWRGGVSKPNELFRETLDYRLWREAIFKRDDWTCIWCNKRGGILNADHIKPFALFPELRLAIDNGRTLCIDCHKTTDSYGKTYTKHERDNLGRFKKYN